jgi:hypothetical protein
MIRTLIMAGGAMLLAVPAVAQTPAAPVEAAPDAARLAAARPVVEKLWPLGTYRRMMGDTMTKLMDGLMESMFDMRAADILPGDKDMKAAAGDKSMGEMAQTADPHFRERMKVTMDVMMGEMIPMMEKMEPAIQKSLTTIYAKKFDAAQLADMNAFFATPSGRAYAEQSMLVFMDPEMIKNMQAFAPEFLKAMPTIMAKVEQATAHLPPPPKPRESPSDDD